MGPILKNFGFPATLYLSTYYMEKGTQVFNVALRYALWATKLPSIDLARVSQELTGIFTLKDAPTRAEVERLILAVAERAASATARQELLRTVCETLGISWLNLEQNRILAFMTADEARALLPSGIDLQLHTHRHRFPTSIEELTSEIEENRESLARITHKPLSHLCYPSGEYAKGTFSHLERLGIRSATTTRRGMNTRDTPLLELRRLLDSDSTPDIVFEAEMSGFLELCRSAFPGWLRRTRSGKKLARSS
jgi:peptidoglycan/xylan/chitin deacetylase (PgdA/CDA1 family)